MPLADAAPLGPRLAKLSERLDNYQLPKYRTLFRAEEIWDTNWKILVQNFTEGYHLFVAHAETIEPAMPTKLANAMHGGEAFSLYEQGRIPGKSYERASDMEVDNPLLTDDERNKALVLFRKSMMDFIHEYSPASPQLYQWPLNVET